MELFSRESSSFILYFHLLIYLLFIVTFLLMFYCIFKLYCRRVASWPTSCNLFFFEEPSPLLVTLVPLA